MMSYEFAFDTEVDTQLGVLLITGRATCEWDDYAGAGKIISIAFDGGPEVHTKGQSDALPAKGLTPSTVALYPEIIRDLERSYAEALNTRPVSAREHDFAW